MLRDTGAPAYSASNSCRRIWQGQEAPHPPQVQIGAARHYQDFAHHLTLYTSEQVAELGDYVRDFGVTSLNEIRAKLTEMGLKLRND